MTGMLDPVFVESEGGVWVPSEYARGPFAGLAGGAVAGLLSATLEQHAEARGFGQPLSASVQFLRPAPIAPLRAEMEVLREGRRVSVLRGSLFERDTLIAVATLTFVRPFGVPEIEEDPPRGSQPSAYPPAPMRTGTPQGPWFMETFDVRLNEGGEYWFRVRRPVTAALTPMARVLGAADWTHGLGRPSRPRLADPNIDLGLQLTRIPRGDWIGVRPFARWSRAGVGRGYGLLLDESGEIGAVSMAVTLLAPAPVDA